MRGDCFFRLVIGARVHSLHPPQFSSNGFGLAALGLQRGKKEKA
jgi:hypothetical protein